MSRTKLLLTVLATLLSTGMAGQVFAAGVTDVGSEAGQISFAASGVAAGSPGAFSSGRSPHASEAGVYQFRFDAPETRAEVAARNYHYDLKSLMKIGTEGGIPDDMGGRMETICGSC